MSRCGAAGFDSAGLQGKQKDFGTITFRTVPALTCTASGTHVTLPPQPPCFTQCLDVLTPIGRGQSMLVCGPRSSGKTQLAIDAILGQAGSGVRCVYAATNCTQAQLAHTVQVRALGQGIETQDWGRSHFGLQGRAEAVGSATW